MSIMGLVEGLPDWVKRPALNFVNSVGPLRRGVSRLVINGAAYAAPVRPRPLSMAANYTTWHGLTDRRFSGRHLPPAEGSGAPHHPDMDSVAALFRRETFAPSTDTSLLFAFFAQWFVDGFLRTKWEAGENREFRENESNHEIDLCQIYGMTDVQTAMLREHAGGRLRMQESKGESWPSPLFEERDGNIEMIGRYRRIPEVDAFTPAVPGLYTPLNFERVFSHWDENEKRHAFAVGLEHGNSTIGHTLMNTLFMREHNRTAAILAAGNPGWSDEQLFQTARNVTIAVLLKIVICDYIVHIAPVPVPLEPVPGMAERERWYRTNWIPVEFALLYRWHPLIPDELVVEGDTLPAASFRRANKWVMDKGLDAVLLAASRQKTGRIGLQNTAPFLADPPQPGNPGVVRLSLEMARACRLQSFNAYREHFGLKPVASFEDLTGETEIAGKLRALYGDIGHLEWFVGLFAESYGRSHMMGALMTTMVANDAFTQALTNPLLAAAIYNDETFGKQGLPIVSETRTLAQVVARNTGIGDASRIGFTIKDN